MMEAQWRRGPQQVERSHHRWQHYGWVSSKKRRETAQAPARPTTVPAPSKLQSHIVEAKKAKLLFFEQIAPRAHRILQWRSFIFAFFRSNRLFTAPSTILSTSSAVSLSPFHGTVFTIFLPAPLFAKPSSSSLNAFAAPRSLPTWKNWIPTCQLGTSQIRVSKFSRRA